MVGVFHDVSDVVFCWPINFERWLAANVLGYTTETQSDAANHKGDIPPPQKSDGRRLRIRTVDSSWIVNEGLG